METVKRYNASKNKKPIFIFSLIAQNHSTWTKAATLKLYSLIFVPDYEYTSKNEWVWNFSVIRADGDLKGKGRNEYTNDNFENSFKM